MLISKEEYDGKFVLSMKFFELELILLAESGPKIIHYKCVDNCDSPGLVITNNRIFIFFCRN